MKNIAHFYFVIIITILLITNLQPDIVQQDFRIDLPELPMVQSTQEFDSGVKETIVEIPINSIIYSDEWYIDTHTDDNVFIDESVDLSAFPPTRDSNRVTIRETVKSVSTVLAPTVLVATPTWTSIPNTSTSIPSSTNTETITPTSSSTSTPVFVTPTIEPTDVEPTSTPSPTFVLTPTDTAFPTLTPTIEPTSTELPATETPGGTLPFPTETPGGTLPPITPGGTLPNPPSGIFNMKNSINYIIYSIFFDGDNNNDWNN